MARCPHCRRHFATLEDEADMHECPFCGYDGHDDDPDDEPDGSGDDDE